MPHQLMLSLANELAVQTDRRRAGKAHTDDCVRSYVSEDLHDLARQPTVRIEIDLEKLAFGERFTT